MKKILLALVLGVLSTPMVIIGQCAIDTTITDAIVPPAGSRFDTLANNDVVVILPYANVNQNYSEVLQFKVPSDTNFAGIMGTIDSIKLVGVLNLPAGMSLSCNPGNCVFIGGSFGCGELSGIPTQPDSIELSIAVEYTITIGTASAPIKDTLGGFYLVIKGQIGVREHTVNQPRVYPNPANDHIFLEPGDLHNGRVEVRIINLVGSEVLRKTFSGTSHQSIKISTSELKPGVYLYQVLNGKKTFTGKFSVAR